MILKTNTKLKMKNCLPYILFAVCFFILLWRSKFGYVNSSDEGFYFAAVNRFAQGDTMFIEDWYVTTPFSFFLIPFVKLYSYIVPNNEGIYLFFRHLYVLTQFLLACLFFKKLNKKHYLASLFFCLIFLMYSPFNIMTFSYNTIGIMVMSYIVISFYCLSDYSKERRFLTLLLCGFLFAEAVLCSPFLLIAWIVSPLTLVVLPLIKIDNKTLFKHWLVFSLGASIVGVTFLIYLLKDSNIGMLIKSLGLILSNPAHLNQSLFEYIYYYLATLLGSVFILPLIVITTFVYLKTKKFLASKIICSVVFLLITIWFVVTKELLTAINFHILIIYLIGLFSFVLCEKKDIKLFLTVFLPTLVYALAIHLGSNQGKYNIASVMICCGFASFKFFFDYFDDLKVRFNKYQIPDLKVIGIVVLTILTLRVSYKEIKNCYYDLDVNQLSATINLGCQKGVVTTEDKKAGWERIYRDTQFIRDYDGDNVIYLCYSLPELYVMDNKRCSTFSIVMEGDQSYINNLFMEYYNIYPEKKPDIGYFDSEEVLNNYLSIVGSDYQIEKMELGSYIILKSN